MEFETAWLNAKEIEAAIIALNRCGVQENNLHLLVEVFHDPEIIGAAKSARRELARRQRRLPSEADDELGRRRSMLERLRDEHGNLLGEVRDMLERLFALGDLLKDGHWLEARAAYDAMMGELEWQTDAISEKLFQLERARAEDAAGQTKPVR